MLEKQPVVAGHEEKPRIPVSLSNEINAATRNHHTALNRLITSRIPLALPPYASDSTAYATGLLHFSHIFLTFESLWADLIRDHATPRSRSASPRRGPSTSAAPTLDSTAESPASPLLSYLLVNPYDSPSLFTSTLGAPTPPSPQLASFLQNLRPKGLLRSARLKRDLEHLLALHPTDLDVLLATYPSDAVAAFCAHIRKSVHEKPWTLVAYAWCFYMAVFSGGRWIRAQLMSKAPPEFWSTNPDDQQEKDFGAKTFLADRGLALWHFSGPHDGEDIKAEFKTRLEEAEALLTPDERVDIIEEAKNIFQLCASLVGELDKEMGTRLDEKGVPAPRQNTAGEKDATVSSEKQDLMNGNMDKIPSKRSDPLSMFIRKPEVTGTIVALTCLACMALFKLQ